MKPTELLLESVKYLNLAQDFLTAAINENGKDNSKKPEQSDVINMANLLAIVDLKHSIDNQHTKP